VTLIALLKDSYREAIDRKIFFAMLILTGLLTVFIASISFRRITVEDELRTVAGQFAWGMSFDPTMGKPTFAVENFRQTNDAAEPWHGDYAFEWVVKAQEPDKLKRLPMAKRGEVRQLIRQGFNYLTSVEVSENLSKDPQEARFAITSRGTNVEDPLAWRYEPTVLFAVPLPFLHTSMREAVYFIENTLVGGVGAWVAVLVGVIVTASFIPDLLRKGAIDLILAKPIRRAGLLLYKYIGGLAFVFLLTAVTVLCVWAAIGVRSGIWSTGFLLVVPAVTFYFALLYSVSTLTAVLTRSTVVSILMTCAVWFVFWLNGAVHSTLDGIRKTKAEAEARIRDFAGAPAPAEKPKDADADDEDHSPVSKMDVPRWVYAASDTVYKVLPRTGDLNRLTAVWISGGLLTEPEIKARRLDSTANLALGETVAVTGAFIALMLGLACWKFARTDY
jgi:ABC-2 family transporter protein